MIFESKVIALRHRLTEWACQHCSRHSQRETEDLRCDILLFVATPTEEEKLEEVARSLELNFQEKQGRAFTYFDLGQVGTFRVMAVKTEMGPFAHDGSAAHAILAKTETKASSLVSLGMAFGTSPKEQNPGDIVVSKILLPYDNRRVYSESGEVKTDYGTVKPYLAKQSLIVILSNFAARTEWRSRVNIGALLTGGARIQCSAYRDELARNLSDHGEVVIGGEMEGVGLLSASDPGDPCWIIVKGISDFADESRADLSEAAKKEFKRHRALACENAARFVLSAFKDFDPATLFGNTPITTKNHE